MNHATLRDHTTRVMTDHPVSSKTAAMETATTTTGPLTVARLARALTYLMYAFVALVLRALIEWLTDRIAEMGYVR